MDWHSFSLGAIAGGAAVLVLMFAMVLILGEIMESARE